jgi:TPR repeat protein
VAFFRKGCESGIAPDACIYLGDSYRLGYGVEKDTEKANQIFSKYCNMPNIYSVQACDQLTGGDMLKQIR